MRHDGDKADRRKCEEINHALVWVVQQVDK